MFETKSMATLSIPRHFNPRTPQPMYGCHDDEKRYKVNNCVVSPTEGRSRTGTHCDLCSARSFASSTGRTCLYTLHENLSVSHHQRPAPCGPCTVGNFCLLVATLPLQQAGPVHCTRSFVRISPSRPAPCGPCTVVNCSRSVLSRVETVHGPTRQVFYTKAQYARKIRLRKLRKQSTVN